MSIVKKSFGRLPDGREADLYVLTNKGGASVEITNYGGIIRAINVPDKAGKIGNVVLGYNHVAGYCPTTNTSSTSQSPCASSSPLRESCKSKPE